MKENSKTIYLVKANNNLISHCTCADALIGAPAQFDCPWCGCGWLFVCARCRKAFTFARAKSVDLSWDQLAHRDLDGKWGSQPSPEDVSEWIEFMKILLKDITLGEEYVYLDGWIFPADSSALQFNGWHAHHELGKLPQIESLKEPLLLERTLGSIQYWQDRKLPDD
jgi:hypothetical protein